MSRTRYGRTKIPLNAYATPRPASPSWVIKTQNELAHSGSWGPVYSNLDDAQKFAIAQAAGARDFMVYTICEGTRKDPGRDVPGMTYRGVIPRHGI